MSENNKRNEGMVTNSRMYRCTFAVMGLMLLAFLICVGGLVWVQLVNGEHYKQIAESQQLSSTKIPASRGTIYDRNMDVIAQSSTSWRVYIVPSMVKDDDTADFISEQLSSILGMDSEKIRKIADRNTGYEIVKTKVDSTVKKAIEDLIYSSEFKKYNLVQKIGVEQDAKRYYPNASLASTVIGFTGMDDQGVEGIERYYEKYLAGTAGKVINAVNGKNMEMPNSFETVIDAQQGNSLVLTIDSTLQYYLEKNLDTALEETNSKGAYGIIMKVDTGEVLAMSSKPDYDLNSPWTLTDEDLLQKLNEIEDDDERNEAISNAVLYQRRNHAVSDTYQPGSVFKVVTAAAALEEGVVTTDEMFNCPGYIIVAGRKINCHHVYGHGSETFVQGLMNSCNPVFINVGLRLGVDTFMEYFKAFGLDDKTGIDMMGESTSITHEKLGVKMGVSELASCAFGQTFQITPIQMITAVAAVANGGKLMQPYVVKEILDENGNTIFKNEPTVKRQVVSEETASTLCSMLEKVVAEGTGKNAYVAGYRIAGKTGTSEKIGETDENGKMQYIASFVGFAPANDPEIILLVILDEPQSAIHTGGGIAAPLAASILSESLEYLNVDLQYTDQELENLRVYVPNIIGNGISDAKSKLINAGFQVKVIGNGSSVISQMPSAYSMIARGGTVVVYTDSSDERTVEMPNLSGYTVAQVNSVLTNLELNLVLSGSSLNSGDVIAYSQSIPPGEKVKIGTAVTVTFVHITGVDDM